VANGASLLVYGLSLRQIGMSHAVTEDKE